MSGPVSFWKTLGLDYLFLALGIFGNGLLALMLSGPAILAALYLGGVELQLLLIAAIGHTVVAAAYAGGAMWDEWDELEEPSLLGVIQSRDVRSQDDIGTFAVFLMFGLLAVYINTILVLSVGAGLLAFESGFAAYAPIVALSAPIADRMFFDVAEISPATLVVLVVARLVYLVSGISLDVGNILRMPVGR